MSLKYETSSEQLAELYLKAHAGDEAPEQLRLAELHPPSRR